VFGADAAVPVADTIVSGGWSLTKDRTLFLADSSLTFLSVLELGFYTGFLFVMNFEYNSAGVWGGKP